VLLTEDIDLISDIIQNSSEWVMDPCRHYAEERRLNPLLFTYQSVHYILRPKNTYSWGGDEIPTTTPCEVQIRTLLQHAHAELTHDAIYKSKRTIRPEVHRTVAKSMALIETTDEFFSEVTRKVNYGPLEEHKILSRLDGLYQSLIGLTPHTSKSSLTIWDEFEDLIDEHLVENIQVFLGKHTLLSNMIKEKYSENYFYQQSTVPFVFWMLKKKRRRLLNNWPLAKTVLDPLANDLGISTEV